MTNGRPVWQRPLGADQGSPSGRGILTANRLYLPLDTPEVLELDLNDGRITSRSAARGNAVPGNLLAYRGEVISQGSDSLDVFHQSAALDSRIETALKTDAHDAWALLWRGQLDLDQGRIVNGIAAVREAHALQPSRVPASVVAAALLFALQLLEVAGVALAQVVAEGLLVLDLLVGEQARIPERHMGHEARELLGANHRSGGAQQALLHRPETSATDVEHDRAVVAERTHLDRDQGLG